MRFEGGVCVRSEGGALTFWAENGGLPPRYLTPKGDKTINQLKKKMLSDLRNTLAQMLATHTHVCSNELGSSVTNIMLQDLMSCRHD